METLTKDILKYNINSIDFEGLTGYLKNQFNKSTGSFLNKKWIVLDCLNYIRKPVSEILMLDIVNYFDNILEKKNIKLISKETYRSHLKSFFNYMIKIFLSQKVNYNNPVPGKNIYEFKQKSGDLAKQSEEIADVFTNEELLNILKKAKKKSERDFIIFSLLTTSGPRISEILTIKIHNINLEERFFETGDVKDAMKTTRMTKKTLLFFFPEKFVPYLGRYINNCIDKSSDWLFPARRSYYSPKSFWPYVVDNFGRNYSKFHKFRRTLISNRVKKPLECPLWISEGLMNHVSSSTEGKHYIKLSLEEKREYYDRYFPYYNFPYF